jgi:uracil-DNA glycosylase family 4
MTLKELEEKTKKCSKCALCQGRSNLVFGDGNENADLVFIGEAPGFHEDQQGKPFVGAAGKLLSQLLDSIGLQRDQVYIANILKCRPPNNRDPLPEEIEVCKPVLQKQLEIINPKIVVTLGAHSTRVMLKRNVSISSVRGQKFKIDGRMIFPVYHPAAALYNRSNIGVMEEDFKKLKEMLDENPPPKLQPKSQPEASHNQDQLF